MYEGDDLNYDDVEALPEEASNRTFFIAAGILGGIVLLTLCLIGAYVVFIVPQGNAAQQTQSAIETQNAGTIKDALTATEVAFALSQTPQVSDTPFPSDTPVVAQPSATDTLEFTLTPDPLTATVGAGFTQVAASTATVVATSTALPISGFADEVGLPGLVIAAMVLVTVIFLARRLRVTPTR